MIGCVQRSATARTTAAASVSASASARLVRVAGVPHNPVVPAHVQNATLRRIFDAVSTSKAAGERPVIFVDLDLTSLIPRRRLMDALRAAGQANGIPDLADPERFEHLLPGYTEEAWPDFVEQSGLRAGYPSLDWSSPSKDPSGAAARAGGPIYRAFRGSYWQGDWATDEPAPGLAEFTAQVEQLGGKVLFVSGRPGAESARPQSEAPLRNAGIVPTLLIGQKRTGLPVPRPGVRDGDADTKAQLAIEAEKRGERVVAIIDDRGSNRGAVLQGVARKPVISVAVASPGLSAAPDALDARNPDRLSTFAVL